MKKTFKLLLAIFIILSTIISNFIGISTKVEAATFFADEADLYEKNVTTGVITYNGEEIITTYVYYTKDGTEYPAYCISPWADGVGEYGSYTVTVDSLLNDAYLWRVITNGYPYKSISELGCNSKEEAFIATKQAVYCAIYGREASWYGSLGASGDRVINAMTQILSAANSSSAGKPSGNIEINTSDDEWQLDSDMPNYISKTFSISASTSYDTYTVTLEGTYPSGTTIFDTSGNPKTTFTSGEQFKISIPANFLNTNGQFDVNVKTKLKTKPVLFGRAPEGSNLQNYALTASIYEDATGSITLEYAKNKTKLEILKQDSKTQEPLNGVEFKILDKSKNPAYTDLITNNDGKIVINGLAPGKYFLEEVKAPNGYTKYDEQIEFDIAFNQELTITVNNSEKKKTEIKSDKKTIDVINDKEKIVAENSNESITQISNEQSTKIVNKNSDINKLSSKLDVLINNENSNLNKAKQEQDIKIDNKNSNVNINDKKQTTKVETINNNVNVNKEKEDKIVEIENNNKNINSKNTTEITSVDSHSTNANINTNSNISSYNGSVKLPKTGM